ncbi:D-aspartate ligase [Candidatus Methylomirabilis lanthanidiphila]|uniref:D-aspartate ligase n=1 Tax=Candidatus Methylomirabilis lanthanidiphila TaxID=2211376 RepID=A0A564ZHU3_9BACT|nr:D-aspartate ligase [Candidatus Methylomirabilis lanthanidiphila]
MAVVYPDNLAALGVCRALGVLGIRVTVLSSDRTAPGQYSRYATRVACPAQSGEAELIDFLVEFGRAQQPNPVLFLTDDASIVALHRHRHLLENYYRFPLAPWPVLRRIMLKDQLYRSLEGVVPLPRTCVPIHERQLADVAGDVGYPALIKPLLRCLSDSADLNGPPFEKLFGSKAVRVHTFTALTDAYRTASAHGFRVVVQEEIEGPPTSLYSLGLYAARHGGVKATFTSQKLGQVPADFGDGLIVRAVRAPELIPLGERVIRHVGYYGIADIEFKWDARAKLFKLLDINPRPWLWINLLTACGVNLSYAAYLDALGRPINPTLFDQRDFQTRWISMRGFLVSLIRSLGAKRHDGDLLGLLRHCRGQRIGPLFNVKDPLFRMFLSPGYWRDAWLQASREIQRLHTSPGAISGHPLLNE